MKYEVEDYIDYPHAEVFDTFLNHLEKIAEFIPDIKEIRVLEASQKGDKAKRVNQWVASKELPGFLKKFFNVQELGWIDRAEWNVAKNYVDYELELPAFGKYVGVRGHNEITPKGKGTRILIAGEMTIEIEKHPAVPGLVARALRPKIEKFVVELIKPNLVNSNRAMEKYLASKTKKGK